METENPSSTHCSSALSKWLIVGVFVTFGFFVRLFRVEEQLILDDEWHALNAVQNYDYWWIFSHFGHADHSIPLALLYEFFSHTIGLGEITMRLPSLFAGVLTLLVLPALMRPWLKRNEIMVMVGLIAISPFLINYSRIARPYALVVLLAGATLPLAWRWWHNNSRISGVAWFTCTVFAAWLNPVSLTITTGPFLWFGGEALAALWRVHDRQKMYRLVFMGLSMCVALAMLFYTPLANDFASLAVKSGTHHVETTTFLVAFSLFSGSGHLLVMLAVAIAFLIGLLNLYRRDPSFSFYLLVIACAATLTVTLTGAAWINYGLVLARYLIGFLPLFLALTAIGLVQISLHLTGLLKLPAAAGQVLTSLALLILLLSGPLPQTDAMHSQFIHHMINQFDYDPERNPFTAALGSITPESFYQDIANANPAGDAVVIEAPWHLESQWNPLPLYQAVHGQKVMIGFVGGVCADDFYGEIKSDVNGLTFTNFTSIQEVINRHVSVDYLILRNQGIPDSREIPIDFKKCERMVREALGEPWRTTKTAQVFRIDSGS